MGLKIVKAELSVIPQGSVVEEIQEAQPEAQSIAQGLNKPKTVGTDEEALVIEILDLEKRIREVGADKMIKRKDEIRKKLLESQEVKDADEGLPFAFDADEGKVIFSACSKKFTLTDKVGLLAALGEEVFLELASISTTDLKKVLSENEVKKYGVESAGTRTLKAVEPV